MARIDVVCACVLVFASAGDVQSVQAEEGDGPAPVNTTQSLSAGADDEAYGRAPERRGTNAYGHASGIYTGVVPQRRRGEPAASGERSGPPTITWPGFQMLPDGSSRVFIQSTAPLDAKVVASADGTFELDLPRARVAARTNRLPLDTRFFNTPVTRVSLSVLRGGAQLQLDLRAPVKPQVSSERGPEGYYFTYIVLPKGRYVQGAAEARADDNPQKAKPAPKVVGKPSANGAGNAAASGDASGAVAPGTASAKAEGSVSAGIKLGL